MIALCFAGQFWGYGVDLSRRKSDQRNQDFSLKTDSDWKLMKTTVDNKVSIGTSSTILGGIHIGENSIIGAGSVVTSDVPPNVIVAGNPAKILRKLD